MNEIFGVSRSRDKKGVIVKQTLNPYVNCIHTLVGGGLGYNVSSSNGDRI